MSPPTTPIRGLSPITELPTPNSFRTLTLQADSADEHGHSQDNQVADGDRLSIHSRNSDETVRQSENPHPVDNLISVDPHDSNEPLCAEGPTPPNQTGAERAETVRRIPVPPLVPLSLGKTAEPQASSSKDTTASPGGLSPPSRSGGNNMPKLIKRVTPPPSASPFGAASNEARRRYLERYYPDSKEAIARREVEDKEKEAAEKLAKEKMERAARVEAELKLKDTKVKFEYQSSLQPTMIDKEVESTESESEHNMAGVGASAVAVRQRTNSRPSSLYGSPPPSASHTPISHSPRLTRATSEIHLADLANIPSYSSQHLHPAFHNVPFFFEDAHKQTKTVNSPSTSRSGSIIKPRPHTYHPIGPPSGMTRSSSYGGSRSTTQMPHMAIPFPSVPDGSTLVNPERQELPKSFSTDALPVPRSSTASSPQPSRSSSTASSADKNAAKDSYKGVTRVSSILSSIFGSGSSGHGHQSSEMKPEKATRRLSKRMNPRKSGGGSAKSSRRSSPAQSPESLPPLALLGDLGLNEGQATEPLPVFRSSGIFGIRDDGSDVYSNDLGLPRQLSERAGSPHTQSDRVERVLYVENNVEEPEQMANGADEGGAEEEGFYTPMALESPGRLIESTTTQYPSQKDNVCDQALTNCETLEAQTSLAQGQESSSSVSSIDHGSYSASGTFSPQRGMATPSPSERVYTTQTTPEMITRTSLLSSRASTTHRRLPLPPSVHSPDSQNPPVPRFIPSQPPLTAAPADLPLLIASHLLSTHAAALLRHSISMQDTSEVMHKMARESLEWGGILMGMAEKMSKDPGLAPSEATNHQQLAQEAGRGTEESLFNGISKPAPRSRTPLDFESLIRGMPTVASDSSGHISPSDQSHNSSIPLQEALDRLTKSVAGTPELVPGLQSHVHLADADDRRQGGSLPAEMLPEAQPSMELGNVRTAKDAWTRAMGEMVEEGHGGQGVERKDLNDAGTTNGLSANAIIPDHARFSLPPTCTYSCPTGTDGSSTPISPYSQPQRVASSLHQHETSFLEQMSPQMGHFPPMDGEETLKRRRFTYSSGPGQGHAYADPLIRPVEGLRSVSATVSATPGYTDEQLNPSSFAPLASCTVPPGAAPCSTVARPERVASMEVLPKMGWDTGHAGCSVAVEELATSGSRREKGRKLRKEEVMKENKNGGKYGPGLAIVDEKSTLGKKKRWWSRRSSVVEA